MGKYQAYAQYQESGEEWLGKVPYHWDVIQIKHLSVVKRGASPRPIDDAKYFDENGEYAWTRIADVTASDVYLTRAPQRLSDLGSSLSVKLEPESLFLSIAGTVGKPCITGMKACIHDGFVYFPELKIPSKFLFYVFAGEQAYKGLGKFGTQLNLNTDTVGGIKIGCTTNDELEGIINFLDHETAKIDTLIDKQQQLITLLKEKRQAVISHAVTKGLNPNAPMRDSGVEWLGEVPAHWELPKLIHRTSRIGDGLHSTPKYQDNTGYYFVNGNNLVNGQISIGATAKEVPEEEYKSHYVHLDESSVMLSINGTIGNVARYNGEKIILGKSAAYMNCSDNLLPEYLLLYLQSSQALRYFDLEVTGTTIFNLSLNSIRQMRVCIPLKAEQVEISEFCTFQRDKYDALIHKARSAIALMLERRTALISAAVTGKIDIRNWVAPVTTNNNKEVAE
ncbi:MAG: restriction endonuclease subunit S [Zhongshania sp.]|uniref:restriction endonuclease subunit S n=1 Tax=Spongiibacter sp. IMCC21906 TaxID=1620392 RepID=UPI00062DE4F2|nr:restriction endonuclease subunit S [Spongiibacter sp. IMCC21906]AKH68802.1 restriction endonuclease S subunit [Spongiibacter sp. IMCC21906]MBQ0758390.1 restriction endonuclease subunit S [Zhongshania sp.]